MSRQGGALQPILGCCFFFLSCLLSIVGSGVQSEAAFQTGFLEEVGRTPAQDDLSRKDK